MLSCSTLARRLARRAGPALLGGLVAAALVAAAPARASTLTVTDTSDAPTDPGSLRSAVNAALPGDTITFAPGVTGTITLIPANGPLTFSPPASGAPITLVGPGAGALAIDGGRATTVFAVFVNAVGISGLTIQNGLAPKFAYGGGGFTVEGGGALTLTACTVAGSTAPNGGGLYVGYGASAALTACAVTANTSSEGGGLYVNGAVSLTDCTVAGNTASMAGGGVFVDSNDGGCVITASTLTGNTASGTGGGLDVLYDATASLGGSIVAGNTAGTGPDIAVDASDPSFHGTLTSAGYNLIGVGDGGIYTTHGAGDQVGTASAPLDARFDSEGAKINGGPTPTVALLAGSPALDKVPATAAPATDQRGAPRPANADGKADIGAFEAQANDSVTDLAVNVNPALQGQAVTFTAHVLSFTGAPTGTVKFATGGQSATATVNASGLATVTTSALGLGLHAVTAAYSGSARFKPSASAALTEHILYASKTLKVTDKADNPSDPNSLRSVVNNARPGTVVTFPGVTGTLTLTSGPLVISGDLSLVGPGAGSLAIDGGRNGSVLVITGGVVSLSGLTLQNGLTAGSGGGIDQQAGTLTLTSCALSGSGAGNGGGLYSGGKAALNGCLVTGNTATGYGGGVYAANPITLTGCTVQGNMADAASSYCLGGGIYGADAVTLSGCTVLRNSAASLGGGVYTGGALSLDACLIQSNTAVQGKGGGIFTNGAVTASFSALLNNTAGRDAGGAYVGGYTVDPITGLLVPSTLTGCLVSGNTARNGAGGGLFVSGPFGLTACLITGSTSRFDGGGLYDDDASDPLTLTNCTVSGNTVTDGGGGGLYASGPVALTGSTLSGNTSLSAGGGLFESDTAVLTNCTVAGNTSQASSGGGLYDDGALTLTGCTFTGNAAPKGLGGGLYVDYLDYITFAPVTATLQSTLLAGNTAGADPDVSVSTTAPDFGPGSGPFAPPVVSSAGYDLIGVGGATYTARAKTDQVGTASAPLDARLDPNGLQFNGGLTQTVALLAGSPALDKVPATAAPATDQRGAPRPGNADGKADIGAFEAQLKPSGPR